MLIYRITQSLPLLKIISEHVETTNLYKFFFVYIKAVEL